MVLQARAARGINATVEDGNGSPGSDQSGRAPYAQAHCRGREAVSTTRLPRLAGAACWRLQAVGNWLSGLSALPYERVYYVSEQADWVIQQIGLRIAEHTPELRRDSFTIAFSHRGIRKQVLHFGARTIYSRGTWTKVDASNRVLFTWFHGDPQDKSPANVEFFEELPQAAARADRVITASKISAGRLERAGVPREKLLLIPLGVDLELFRPASDAARSGLRAELGIPPESLCIGSFQKDGIGWDRGMEPKLIKGPDIFLEVVAGLKRSFPVFVLLTGPARGYVIDGLKRLGVPYVHRYLRRADDVASMYGALDLYLVTSRDEGGPLAVLESLASGVPLVTTRVGMAPDVIDDGINGRMVRVEDVEGLTEAASSLLTDPEARVRIAAAGLAATQAYSWPDIVQRYWNEAYIPLLESGG